MVLLRLWWCKAGRGLRWRGEIDHGCGRGCAWCLLVVLVLCCLVGAGGGVHWCCLLLLVLVVVLVVLGVLSVWVVLVVVLVVVSAVRVLKRGTGFNPIFAGLFGGWVAFQAQSIISINQIGLAIWGWVLSGLIIGYEINTRDAVVVEINPKKGRVAGKPVQSSAGSVVALFVAFVLGVLVGMPPYVASAKFKSALETSNPTIIQQTAYIWPLDAVRMIQVSLTLDENKLGAQALKVSVDATEKFPDNYSVWAALNTMKSASDQQRSDALVQMKRLDPLNPTLK